MKLFRFGRTDLAVSLAVPFLILAGLYGWALVNTPDNITCEINPNLDTTVLIAGNAKFDTEIAKTGQQKTTGLSNRNCIESDHAMIFPYDQTGDYCFWMKDMNFSIDMIWLDDDKKLVTIKSDVSPDTYPQTFCPDKPAMYVVEFAAGTAKSNNWQLGQQFDFAL